MGVFQIVLGALSVAVHSFMLSQYHNLTVDVSLINKTQVLLLTDFQATNSIRGNGAQTVWHNRTRHN